MSTVTIEKGIPIPDICYANVGRKPSKYPFVQMEVGDSFVVATENEVKSTDATRRYRIKRGDLPAEFRLVSRKLADGFRVWRIA